MELGGVAMFELTKPQYPKKQTINLAVQEVKGISKEWQIAIFCVFILLLILFTKFAVIGRIEQAEKVRNEYMQTAETIRDLNERLIDVKWNDTNKKYPTSLLIKSLDNNILMNIVAKTSNTDITIQSIKSLSSGNDYIYQITVLVENKERLVKYMNDLNMIPNVLSVERLIK